MSDELRQAQKEATTNPNKSLPVMFSLTDSNQNRMIDLKVATKAKNGMEQRYLQIDVANSTFTVLSSQRTVIAAFGLHQLSGVDFVEDLMLRVTFRTSAFQQNKSNLPCLPQKQPLWTQLYHTMTMTQRNYIGALLQGLVGLDLPLNKSTKPMCSQQMLEVGRESFRLWTGTWNLGNNPPPEFSPCSTGVSPSFRPWLLLDEIDHDIYSVGFQECTDDTFEQVGDQLGPEFIRIASKRMGVIGMVVFVRRRLVPFIDSVEMVHEAVGFAGVGTNKGFVAVSFRYNQHPLLFVNCHLAARDDLGRLKQRVRQMKLCVKRLKLGTLASTDVLHQFSVFFVGDMNFRICVQDKDAWPNSGRVRQEYIHELYKNAQDIQPVIDDLIKGDQLSTLKAKGDIFDGFHEAPITFAPTYKYIHFGTSVHWTSVKKPGHNKTLGHEAKEEAATAFSQARCLEDLGPEHASTITGYYFSNRKKGIRREYTDHKLQAPSWCDRILYKVLPGVEVVQHSYKAIDNIMTSDHVPVCANFTMVIPKPPSAMPQAAFHVGVLQFLKFEVVHLRHPREPVSSFFENATAEMHAFNAAKEDEYEGEGDVDMDVEDGEGDVDMDVEDADGLVHHYANLKVAAVMSCMKKAGNKYKTISKTVPALTPGHTWADRHKPHAYSEVEYRFTGKDLQSTALGPFLTTREFLQSQFVSFHLLPKSTNSTGESIAVCNVSLRDVCEGTTMNFTGTLQHNGQPSGTVRGQLRLWLSSEGWREEYVQNPSSHPLFPKNLTNNYGITPQRQEMRRKDHRRPSPAPPTDNGMYADGTFDEENEEVRPSPLAPLNSPIRVVLNGEDPEDEGLKLAHRNAVINASSSINARDGKRPTNVINKKGPRKKSAVSKTAKRKPKKRVSVVMVMPEEEEEAGKQEEEAGKQEEEAGKQEEEAGKQEEEAGKQEIQGKNDLEETGKDTNGSTAKEDPTQNEEDVSNEDVDESKKSMEEPIEVVIDSVSVDETNPVEEINPIDETNPVEEINPIDETNPVEEINPIDETVIVEEITSVDEAEEALVPLPE